MPVTLGRAPGVYVNVVPSDVRSITGVSTSTAGFIGEVDDVVIVPQVNPHYDPTQDGVKPPAPDIPTDPDAPLPLPPSTAAGELAVHPHSRKGQGAAGPGGAVQELHRFHQLVAGSRRITPRVTSPMASSGSSPTAARAATSPASDRSRRCRSPACGQDRDRAGHVRVDRRDRDRPRPGNRRQT